MDHSMWWLRGARLKGRRTQGKNEVKEKKIVATQHLAVCGDVVFASGRLYHRRHFQCATCRAQLPDLTYYPSGTHVICIDCHLDEINPKCDECGRAVCDEYLNVDDKNLHHDCFLCTRCRNPMPGGQYMILDEKYFDEDCYYTMKYKLAKPQ